ncbi:uncharacterized protein SEPMUDRAFT_61946 [Sphaerulina musiva SO2202]|uniref:CST complex subunit Ten1 n=1 Tax=Sphaerulina musiva (strain SO2202) TaxID=692275 RepID=M3B2L1_SPHMS|nr:uncharacterized protein SEPMUDRAFT_61946 [Sphaerulina musiva SO2202]EMF14002.1 hypothetical protein SEPMUDRAFT_61946 [Sphaerulina musiva SO2202]
MATNHDPTCRRPEPARLLLLDQVRHQEPGTKIRVLGCVHAYHIASATLVLKLEYPSKSSNSRNPKTLPVPTVLANIDNVLEAVNHDLLQVGSWLNVVGYVRKPQNLSGRRRRRDVIPLMDVLLIWSAGAIKLDDYQSAVRSYQETLLPGTTTTSEEKGTETA